MNYEDYVRKQMPKKEADKVLEKNRINQRFYNNIRLNQKDEPKRKQLE